MVMEVFFMLGSNLPITIYLTLSPDTGYRQLSVFRFKEHRCGYSLRLNWCCSWVDGWPILCAYNCNVSQISQVPVDEVIAMCSVDRAKGLSDYKGRCNCPNERCPNGTFRKLCETTMIKP